MALDASIPQGFRPIQVDSPVNALAQVLQVQNMQRQNALAQLQMQDYQAKRQQEAEQLRQAQEQQAGQRKYLDSINPNAGPALPFNAAQALQFFNPEQVGKLQGLLNPKKDLFAAKPGEVVLDKADPTKPVFTAPAAPEKPPEVVRLMLYRDTLPAGHPARAVIDSAITKMTTHAPAAQVSVNTGQKGFDNTLKLRGDFRSEPVYKAHQEMTSAYAQIQQALKQASPAGDLAGATKIMKLLDPGSVVRESELGMAMAASGLLDRVSSYATNILNGTKLTPTQRKDFERLANALYQESVNQYNAKRKEYEGIASRNGLPVSDVLGDPAAIARPNALPSTEAIDAEIARRQGKP